MELVSIFLEIGNIIFFMGSLPQLYKTLKMIKNKEKMKGVSSLTFLAFASGCVFFATVGYLLQSWFTFFLNTFDVGVNSVIAWWARKK